MNAMNNLLILWKAFPISNFINIFKKGGQTTTNSNRFISDYTRDILTNNRDIVRWFPSGTASLSSPNHSLQKIETEELAPLRHFIKKWFPFVLDVTNIQVSNGGRKGYYDPYTFTPTQSGTIVTIYFTVSPIHFTELYFDKNIEDTFNNIISEKVFSMIRMLYPKVIPIEYNIKVIWSPVKTSTILEYLS